MFGGVCLLFSVVSSNTKMIYVYDFLSMWTFYVELADISEQAEGVDYPNLMYVHGQLPDSPPDRDLEWTESGIGGCS